MEFNRVRIHYLSAQGVLEVEQGSLRELERSLPREWMGFAAFRLLARGSKLPLDVDLLVLTSNRILVVELKNWAGDIEYSAGQWIHKGTPKRSPVEVNDNKARVLKGFIKDKDSAEEREAMGLGIDIIKRVSGRRPRGYRAPSWGVSKNTIRYLIDERKMPPHKLALGIPLYGRGFSVADPYASTRDQPKGARRPGGDFSRARICIRSEGVALLRGGRGRSARRARP